MLTHSLPTGFGDSLLQGSPIFQRLRYFYRPNINSFKPIDDITTQIMFYQYVIIFTIFILKIKKFNLNKFSGHSLQGLRSYRGGGSPLFIPILHWCSKIALNLQMIRQPRVYENYNLLLKYKKLLNCKNTFNCTGVFTYFFY